MFAAEARLSVETSLGVPLTESFCWFLEEECWSEVALWVCFPYWMLASRPRAAHTWSRLLRETPLFPVAGRAPWRCWYTRNCYKPTRSDLLIHSLETVLLHSVRRMDQCYSPYYPLRQLPVFAGRLLQSNDRICLLGRLDLPWLWAWRHTLETGSARHCPCSGDSSLLLPKLLGYCHTTTSHSSMPHNSWDIFCSS